MTQRLLTRYTLPAALVALALAGCAPGELKQADKAADAAPETVAVADAPKDAAPEAAAPATVADDDATTGLLQFPAQPAPEGYKLPWPDAMPAIGMKETGKRGGSFTVSVIGEPKTFNVITNNESSSSQVVSKMFSSLLGFDPDKQEYYPLMLKSLTVADDQKTWTATLRDGLKWSDGQPITADDIMFTMEVVYDSAIINPGADVLKVNGEPLKFEKVDDLTVTITASQPTGFMHVMLASIQPMPRHAVEEAYKAGQFDTAMSVNTDPSKLVVSGPFKLQVYQPGERVVLTRNEHYFVVDKEGTRLPYLDAMNFALTPDLDSTMAKFRAGQADALDSPRPEVVPDLRDAQAKENFTLYDKGPGDSAGFFWFNMKPGENADGKPYVRAEIREAFDSLNFRKAVYHSINRDGMIRTVLRGLAVKINSNTPVALKDWYNPDLPDYNYDLDKARALLDEAGFKDTNGDGIRETPSGKPLAFTFITNVENKTRIELATIISTDLRSVGIQATAQSVDFNTLVTQLNDSFQYEACLLGFAGSIHPMTSMNVWRSTGRTHYWNPLQKTPATEWEAEIDRLANEFSLALDFPSQQKIFFRMQELLMENIPTLPLYSSKTFSCVRNTFGNVRPTPFGDSHWNAEELYVK